MREVRFTKAHGCGNDFLIVPGPAADYGALAGFVRSMCDRHYGVGADGVYFVSRCADCDAAVELYNSDGSPAELSGNGTRCVAGVLVEGGSGAGGLRVHAESEQGDLRPIRIRTAAGIKDLWMVEHSGRVFRFRMRVGPASIAPGPEGTLSVWLGNPHCVVFTDDFAWDWPARGRTLTNHSAFPAGANVDFVRVVDRGRVEGRFWERGAGYTLASGTGSTAAAVAAIHQGFAESPVAVETEGGILRIEWRDGADAILTGPAEIICEGTYYGK